MADAMADAMDGWMDGRTDGWMDGWTDGRTDGWTDGRTDGWTNGQTDDGRMDVSNRIGSDRSDGQDKTYTCEQAVGSVATTNPTPSYLSVRIMFTGYEPKER